MACNDPSKYINASPSTQIPLHIFIWTKKILGRHIQNKNRHFNQKKLTAFNKKQNIRTNDQALCSQEAATPPPGIRYL